jgi:hypothetical protein
MATYKINAPPPGSYVEGFGLLVTGSECEMPDDYPPHRLWEPVDAAARACFERAAATVVADAKSLAADEGRTLTAEEIKKIHDGRMPIPNPELSTKPKTKPVPSAQAFGPVKTRASDSR